jgi:hypothetical protein
VGSETPATEPSSPEPSQPTFDPEDVSEEDSYDGDAPNGQVDHLLALPDGGYIAIGLFSRVGNEYAPGIAKFNRDGIVDTEFLKNVSHFTGTVAGVRLLGDGSIALFGQDLQVNDSLSSSVIFMNTKGQLDQAKMEELEKAGGLTGQVLDLKEDRDGKLHLVGNLPKQYDDDTTNYSVIAANGSVEATFDNSLQTDHNDEDPGSNAGDNHNDNDDTLDIPIADDESSEGSEYEGDDDVNMPITDNTLDEGGEPRSPASLENGPSEGGQGNVADENIEQEETEEDPNPPNDVVEENQIIEDERAPASENEDAADQDNSENPADTDNENANTEGSSNTEDSGNINGRDGKRRKDRIDKARQKRKDKGNDDDSSKNNKGDDDDSGKNNKDDDSSKNRKDKDDDDNQNKGGDDD